MDYDYRKTLQHPTYRTSASSPMYGQSMYPRVGSQHGHVAVLPASRPSPYHHAVSPPPSSSSSSFSSGLGITVVMKPEYRITPPPQLSPLVGDIPRSNFQFDFDFERKIMAEAEKGNQNLGRIAMDYLPSATSDPIPSSTPRHGGDPIVSKYIAAGLNRAAVPLAVIAYGDNPSKVREFVNGYTLLEEMGFSSGAVVDALVLYENDTDKALAHFLNSTTSR